jgi:single-stranded-DNA-specific exonuclease
MSEAKIEPGTHLRGYHVGFVLGPRLNAAGRIDDAALALRLLLTTDELEAAKIASEIEHKNQSRRDEQQRILGEAVELVQEQGAHERNIIVIAKQGWHTGIVGIVAGRLVELFRRPTIVLSIDDKGHCKGSARSIPKFHLADAIMAHPDLLSGGGHAMAAGCSFPQENLQKVVEALDAYAGLRLTPDDFIPAMLADAEAEPSEVTRRAIEELAQLEPFGCANPEPMFVTRGMTLAEVSPTRNPVHVRTLLRSTSGTVSAMGFNLGDRITTQMIGHKIDVAYRPVLDEWRGKVNLKWQIQDLSYFSEPVSQREPELSASTSLV